MGKITYQDKEDRRTANVPDKNKVSAADMIMIKNSVNALYDMMDTLRVRTAIAIEPGDLTTGYYENSALIGMTPDVDFLLYTDNGSGTLLRSGDGYTFNDVNGRITISSDYYRLVYFKAPDVL